MIHFKKKITGGGLIRNKGKDILELIQNATAQLNELLKDVRDIKKTYDKESDKRISDTGEAETRPTQGVQEQKKEDT